MKKKCEFGEHDYVIVSTVVQRGWETKTYRCRKCGGEYNATKKVKKR